MLSDIRFHHTARVGAAPAPRARRRALLLRVGIPAAAILLLMLWILGAFRRDGIAGGRQPVAVESAAGLATAQAATRMISADTEVVGTVEAEQIATVTSRVVANINDMRVSAGQRVAAGDTLAVLDDRDLRHRVEQAQDAALGAEATLAQARSDYARDKPLFDQQVITAYDFEHTQTNLKTAEANYHRLQQAEQEAEVNFSYAVVRSPFSGVVVDKLANLGDLAAPGKPLLTMYEQGRLRLAVNVPENLVGSVHVGQPLAFRVDALNRQTTGKVAEIVPSSDPSSRTVVVRVHLDDTADAVPGMFGRVLLPMKPEPVLALPASAVVRAGQLTMVDVVREGRVERRIVQVGRSYGNQLEVLSGLTPGETVVLRAELARTTAPLAGDGQ